MKSSIPLVVFILLACTPSKHIEQSSITPIPVSGKLFASLFQQRAAEYHALCLQAYNIAKIRVDEWMGRTTDKPKAIVTDIDETVLDNSPYAVHQALQGKDYEQDSWQAWTSLAIADTVPGALSFLKYASSKGIEVFYVTNRLASEAGATLQNLRRWGFPNADENHLQLRAEESGKESRRQKVAADHEIILLLGDNLSDFSSVFDKKMVEQRLQATIDQSSQFGLRFIVLPNPVYGDWESSIYRYSYKLSATQKDSAIRGWLKSYKL